MEILELFDNFDTKCNNTINALKSELAGIRAGRANPHVLDKVMVDYWGAPTPINQMANVSVSEGRILVVSVYDMSAIKSVEKAILAANIGLTPNNDGKVIRLIFPEITEERRRDIVKQVKKLGEDSKVALRNHRREALDTAKKLKKDNAITEDDLSAIEKDIDKDLAKFTDTVDSVIKAKEQDVMSV
ncbi:MAG: ribosome recycling factor [Clostridia bacterium]|nr:ribosome recycling factor [Clostridia bacterium]